MSCKILRDFRDISFPQLFISISMKYFLLKAIRAMEILSGEQMSSPRKMYKLKWNVHSSEFNCSDESFSYLKQPALVSTLD